MVDWHEVRASGADRERAADLLRAAHADGALPWQDYSARLEGLMSAGTHGDIHQLVSDLTDGPGPRTRPTPPPAARPSPSAQAGQSARAGTAYGARQPHPRDPRRPGPPIEGAGPSGPGGPALGRTGPAGPASDVPTVPGTADRLASAALLCGVLVPFTLGLSGIAAIPLGVLARRRLARASDQAPRHGNAMQMATAAIALGAFPIVLGLALLLYLVGR